ncbi:hypothetical protein ACIP93_32875 [Streptomyces sp. NPDC088745]|uniref:hypothetical protein n=1 Tax=Streptomyces sp. NPDC088745 TaxID=3365884 RepID=UPI00381E4EEC
MTSLKPTTTADPQTEPIDLVATRALYQSILGLRYFPDRDVLFRAIADLETTFTAMLAEIDGAPHGKLRGRYHQAAHGGSILIERWSTAAREFESRQADRSAIRRHHDAAFKYAEALAGHVRTLTDVLVVQRRLAPAQKTDAAT